MEKITELMTCFMSRRVCKLDCYKILDYYFGESLECEVDRFIASNTKVLFSSHTGSEQYDESRSTIVFILEVMEVKRSK